MPLTTLLIDDDPSSTQLLHSYLDQIPQYVSVLDVAHTPEKGLDLIEELQPDLVFLDVQMPGKDGFDVLNQCRQITFQTVIVSAHEEFALKAFQHHAFHYILKPYAKTEVFETVERILNGKFPGESPKTNENSTQLEATIIGKKVFLTTQEGTHVLNPSEVIRCEADGSYTQLFLKNGRKLTASMALKNFEKQLEGHGFLRVHKSHLVNLEAIEFVDHTGGIKLYNHPAKIQVALRRRTHLMQALAGG